MNRSAKGLLIVTTNLDDFSLANYRQFAKFVKLSTRQTFLLYGITLLLRKLQHVGHKRVICGSHLDFSVAQWVK